MSGVLKVMRILRDNQNSVMAMLEAFVYDPLISWRLLAQDANGSNAVSQTDGTDHVQAAAAITSSIVAGSAPGSSEVESDRVDSVNVGATPRLTETNGDGDNLPKLVKLKSNTMTEESSQETLNSRYAVRYMCWGLVYLLYYLQYRALEVINRIQSKLNGRDFQNIDGCLSVEEQVDRLITEATSVENLCQLFVGWCPFW